MTLYTTLPHGGTLASLIFLLPLAMPSQPITAQESPHLETVLSVWRKRESATKSLRAEMAGEYLMGKDSTMTGPPDDLSAPESRVLLIDSVKMRSERVTNQWADPIKAPSHLAVVSVFDGRQEKMLSESGRQDDLMHPFGWVGTSKYHPDRLNIYLSPLLWHYRPLSPAFDTLPLNTLRVIGADHMVDGVPCILLESTQPGSRVTKRFWVAPSQEMAILRYVKLFQGSAVTQSEVSFRREPSGWVPSRWKAIRFNEKQRVLSSGSVAVSKLELNIDVPSSSFDIEFPPGTEVFDRTAKKKYIVKPDHSKREVLPREKDVSYTELFGTSRETANNHAVTRSSFTKSPPSPRGVKT